MEGVEEVTWKMMCLESRSMSRCTLALRSLTWLLHGFVWWRCYLGPMQCHQSTLKMSAGGFVMFPGWCDGACTSASLDCMPHPFVLPLAGACVATVAHVAVMLAVLGQAVGWLHLVLDKNQREILKMECFWRWSVFGD